MKKALKITAVSILTLILIALVSLVVIFFNEIKTLFTLHKINDHPFYEMTYHADYAFDEFLDNGGAATDDELVSFIKRKILKGISLKVNPSGACSTFITTTPDGDNLFARNFDYVPSVGLILRTQPKNGYKSISVVNLNHLGLSQEKLPNKGLMNRFITLAAPYAPLEGMNEKGVSIAVLIISKGVVHQETGKVPVTTTSAIRMILDRASSVKEAVSLLSKYDMNSSGSTGYHFQIADASGDTAIVEYIDNEMHVLTKDEGYTAATNFVLYNDMNDGFGQDRYQTIRNVQDETNNIMTQEDALNLLLKVPGVGFREVEGKSEPIKSDTQWSSIYNLDKLTLSICTSKDINKIYNYTID